MLWLQIFRIIKLNDDVLKNLYIKNKYSLIINYLINLNKTLNILTFCFIYKKLQFNNNEIFSFLKKI